MSIASQYTYRQLRRDDVTLLKELLGVFGHAFNDNETYQHAIPTDEYLTNLLGKEHFIVVVAMMGKAVVGGLAGYVLEKFEQQRREIYIYDLAVAAAHRREGIATALILELKKVAAARGAYVVFVQADLGDAPASAPSWPPVAPRRGRRLPPSSPATPGLPSSDTTASARRRDPGRRRCRGGG